MAANQSMLRSSLVAGPSTLSSREALSSGRVQLLCPRPTPTPFRPIKTQAAVVTQRIKAQPKKTVQKVLPKKPVATQKIAKKPVAGTQKGTQKIGPKAGTVRVGGTQNTGTSSTGKKVTSIPIFTKEKNFRPKQFSAKSSPKLLTRVQQLRLLSKVESAGLLTLLEKNGLTLTKIEQSGLLSTAESLGLLSAAADRNTPSLLYTIAFALFAAGPALVYLTPDDSTGLVVLQALVALLCVGGGSAAYGGATLLSTLQKDA